MRRITEKGLPILTMGQKLVSLSFCIGQGRYEDAAGHLCDLLEYCRRRIYTSVGNQVQDLHQMVDAYGKNPAEIDIYGKNLAEVDKDKIE